MRERVRSSLIMRDYAGIIELMFAEPNKEKTKGRARRKRSRGKQQASMGWGGVEVKWLE